MSRMPDRPPHIDKQRAKRAFSRAAHTYDAAAVLQREMGSRMRERLDFVRLEPELILDAGCGTGVDAEALARRYRKSRVLAMDFAFPMLSRARRRGPWFRRPLCLCGDIESVPLADDSVDLVFSNAAFQWSSDLGRVFSECLRVLRPGGLLMFTTFGPDTLKELRSAWASADGHTHVSGFTDMHDIGDLLIGSHFAEPVMDAEWMTLTYEDVDGLMRDLKVLGAGNATMERPRGMTGKARMAAMRSAYEAFRAGGRLPATYEVVYGHAWVPERRPDPHRVDSAVSVVPLERLRRPPPR